MLDERGADGYAALCVALLGLGECSGEAEGGCCCEGGRGVDSRLRPELREIAQGM